MDKIFIKLSKRIPMLNIFKKVILLFTVLLLIPTTAYAHIEGFIELAGSAIYMFLFGVIAGENFSALHLSKKRGLFVFFFLSIIVYSSFFVAIQDYESTPLYILFFKYLIQGLIYGIVFFSLGWYIAYRHRD